MGLQLERMHYWLYDKIVMAEEIEEDIVGWAKDRALPADEWQRDLWEKYGKPTGGKPLKEIINASNSFGWLEDKINSVEYRQAALITAILSENPQYIEDLAKIFAKRGEKAAEEYSGVIPKDPEEVYILLNDYLLDGMPNQRANQVLDGNENLIIWRTTNCLHTKYWEEVNGDIKNFYVLREAWVKAFVEKLSTNFEYEKRPNGNQKIMLRR
jgi:hypothetical protein